MSKIYDYLSDEELKKLMDDAESEGIAKAPENLEAEVLSFIDEKEKRRDRQTSIRAVSAGKPASNAIDYALYCAKVFGSIAAAILILTIAPIIKEHRELPAREEKPIPTREEVIDTNVKSKEDVIKEQESGKIIPKIEELLELTREE
ncbi:MAG: hypothetical protein K6G10_11775 [Butyrivibrio sp.]|nr:hypothetical protein [Butyrivibrio sp.]